MADYTKTSRETLSRKNCKCAKCKGEIKKGEKCIVNPVEKTAKHLNC